MGGEACARKDPKPTKTGKKSRVEEDKINAGRGGVGLVARGRARGAPIQLGNRTHIHPSLSQEPLKGGKPVRGGVEVPDNSGREITDVQYLRLYSSK